MNTGSPRKPIKASTRKIASRQPATSIPHRTRLLPKPLQWLFDEGFDLAQRQSPRQNGLRLVVSVPTERLAALSVILGAASSKPECNDSICEHHHLDETPRRVSCYFDRHLQDTEAWRDSEGHVHIGQSTFTKFEFAINRLPSEFPERTRVPRTLQSRFEAELDDLAALFGDDRATSGIRRSANSTHPILVLGRLSDLEKDIKLASSMRAFHGRHLKGILAPGHGLDKWFRHPVIVADNSPQSLNQPWLDSVRPRLVVRVGRMGVTQPLGNRWPDTPQIVVLSRRVPSSIDAVEIIRAMGWRSLGDSERSGTPALNPISGLIEAEWFIEDTSADMPMKDWGDNEW